MSLLQCLENAVRARWISRDKAEAIQKEVDAKRDANWASDTIRTRLADDLVRQAREAKRRALLQETRRIVLHDQVMSFRNARGEIDPARGYLRLVENYDEGQLQDVESLKWAIIRQVHQELAGFLNEFHKGALSGDLRRRQPELVARMDNIVREIWGQDTGDGRAKALAQSWIKVSEGLRVRSNKAGTAIGKLDGGYLPQSHSAEALLSIGEDAWVSYLMRDGVLDRDKMVSSMSGEKLDDAQLDRALREAWKNITTDGWIDREPGFAVFGRGALAKRRDDFHRFIHFKNADEWLRYHRDFKAGDPFEAMMSHLSVMSRDIATLEVFGPNPDAMRQYLKQVAMRHAADAVPQKTEMRRRQKRALDVIEQVLPGETGRDLVKRIEQSMKDLADASKKAHASGDPEWLARAQEMSQRMDAIERELETLEPISIGERRARLETEIAALDAEIAGRKTETGGKRAQRRNEGLVREAERRRAVLAKDLDKLERQDTSIAGQRPDVYQEAIDAFAELKRQTREMRNGTYWSAENPVDAANGTILKADRMWDLYRGTFYAPVSSKWANGLQSARNLATSIMLGSASISTLADIGNIRQARWMTGMDPGTLKILGGYIDQLKFDRVAAMEAGLMLDSAVHVMHQQARYLESAGFMSTAQGNFGKQAVQWTGFLADRVITLSGMAWMTQGAKWSFGTAIQLEMGKLLNRSFDDLPEMMRRSFERHLITAADWDVMRSSPLHTPENGFSILRPQEIAKRDRAVAEKYLMMIHRETRHAVVEGTLESRTFLDFGRPGTIAGEIGKNIGQFKSFGVAVILLHIGRIVREFQLGNHANAVGMGLGLAVTGALIGSLVNELMQIVNFKDPVLPTLLAQGKTPGVDYWSKGILKAGGLGIYGDLLFAPVDRGNGGLAGALLGPVGGQVERLRRRGGTNTIDWWEDKNKEGKFARDAIATARELTPGQSLWFVRGILQRWGYNQLALAFDPNAEKVFRRNEQMTAKADGNSFWWRPGAALPGRPPMLWPDKAVTEKAPLPKSRSRRAEPEPKPVAAGDAAGQYQVGTKIERSPQRPFSVVDGDTIQVGTQRWRIEGYDAPEVFGRAQGQGERNAGMRAALRLQELIRTGKVEIEVTNPPDKWGRGRARLKVDGNDVAAQMKREGHTRRQEGRAR
jgi:endonuclease YncB( thermonuclease family)